MTTDGSERGFPECLRPPFGWECYREDGHDGPCAAVRTHDEQGFLNGGVLPEDTWRVVGDQDAGCYIPLDGSPRSRALLAATVERIMRDAARGPIPVIVRPETEPTTARARWARTLRRIADRLDRA